MKSDKSFSQLLGSFKLSKVIIPLCLGAVLVMLSGVFGSSQEAKATADDSLAALCSSVEGVGKCYAKASCTVEGEVLAVAIVCEGADDTRVRSELYRMISSFYGIGYNRISVLKISE